MVQLRVGEVKAQLTRCSGSDEPANSAMWSSFTPSTSEIALLVARRVAPTMRRDLRHGFETLLAWAHRVFVLVDAHGIRVQVAASHAALGFLGHCKFVIEGQRGAGGQQGADTAELPAGE